MSWMDRLRGLRSLAVAATALTAPAASPQSLFNKAFTYFDYMGNLEPVSGPSGFLICSMVRYGTNDDIDGFQFTRFDSLGNVVLTRAFTAGPLVNVIQGGALARQRSDGTFSFLFYSHPISGYYASSLRVFNTTPQGSVNWNRKIDYADTGYSIDGLGAMDQAFEETSDGGYLITALREYPVMNTIDDVVPMIAKLDSTGDVLWNKTYDLGQKHGWHIVSCVDPNGGSLLGFHADTVWQVVSDNCILTKIDPDGTTLWSKRIDGFKGMLTGCAKVDGRYVISASDTTSLYILEMDTDGVPLWGKRYAFTLPLSTWGAGIIPTHDHGFVLRKLVPDSTGFNTFFFKVDSLGTVQWERTYGGGFQDPFDLVENKDSTFILLSAGMGGFFLSRLDSSGMNDCITPVNGWLTETPITFSMVEVTLDEFAPQMDSQPLYLGDSLATDPVMIDTCFYPFQVGTSEFAHSDELLIYPVPTSGVVSVRSNGHFDGAMLSLFNALGSPVKSIRLSSSETSIDLGALPSGVYLYRVETPAGKTMSGRLIKE